MPRTASRSASTTSESETTVHSYLRRALLALTTAAAALTVAAGCGGGTATPAHDRADVVFAQMMIPHHRQAITMADLAPQRADSAEITRLARQIKNAQNPEITTMSSWLKSWGAKVPSGSSAVSGMGDGMMPDSDMAKLKAATGKDFDMMFAQMMITHHKGAISMARTELRHGTYPPARKLARSIITSQSAQIATFQRFLDT
jgi:uncharacterized protein (DUF305 family)